MYTRRPYIVLQRGAVEGASVGLTHCRTRFEKVVIRVYDIINCSDIWCCIHLVSMACELDMPLDLLDFD